MAIVDYWFRFLFNAAKRIAIESSKTEFYALHLIGIWLHLPLFTLDLKIISSMETNRTLFSNIKEFLRLFFQKIHEFLFLHKKTKNEFYEKFSTNVLPKKNKSSTNSSVEQTTNKSYISSATSCRMAVVWDSFASTEFHS